MHERNEDAIVAVKRKLRQLKKAELRIRFGAQGTSAQKPRVQKGLVWDAFFDMGQKTNRVATAGHAGSASSVPAAQTPPYTPRQLAHFSKERYRALVADFFFQVYCRHFRETGAMGGELYNPAILAQMGLPPDADEAAVKGWFRRMALAHHPDLGGDAEAFVAMLGKYRTLTKGDV